MSVILASELACERGGRPVFSGLGFELESGRALILGGRNGSGKSSLLRLLAGLLRPAGGSLAWDEAPVFDDLSRHAGRIHYLGHLDAVKPNLTVTENLDFWAGLQQGRHAEEALIHFGLDALAKEPARLLSSGQRRRLALARLLAAPRELWLLDEPSVGLDTASRQRLENALADHLSAGGMAVIATHQALELAGAAALDLDAYPPCLPDLEHAW